MDRIRKSFAVFIILIIAISSLSMVKPTFAQSIPKPSVPQFTVRYIDNSYDIPLVTTTTTDPYNGKQVTQRSGGYHVENKTVEISIKNQPLSREVSATESGTGLYYTVHVKGHFGTEWQEQSVSAIRLADSYSPWPLEYQTTKIQASSSEYTILTYTKGQPGWTLRDGDQIDIQVKAFVGYHKFFWNTDHMFPIYDGNTFIASSESDWSKTQTISILEGSATTSTSSNPTPTSATTKNPAPTPTVPEFPVLVILPFFVSVLLFAVYFKHRRTNDE